MNKRIIISGGGTGGHIYPAIAIANAIMRLAPDSEILFVGALGKMEMEKIPEAGYEIIGLDIQGLDRQSLLKNINLPFKIVKSVRKARTILKSFKPDAVVGVGGYASGPTLLAAKAMRVPYLIQEQNSYAGLTNKRLGKKAERVCVAYEGMEAFFPEDKIVLTGNPIRKEVVDIAGKREAALEHFGLPLEKKTILITGGSLGARTLNESMMKSLDLIMLENIQVIWQCGNYYYDEYSQKLSDAYKENVVLKPYLENMDLAYAAADVIVSRAGAGTISELCNLSKPIVLVPSPNVAEDHQTKNANALVSKDAALLVKDSQAEGILIKTVIELLKDNEKCELLATNSKKMGLYNADEIIASEVLMLKRGVSI